MSDAMIRYKATVLQRVISVAGGLTLGLVGGCIMILVNRGVPSTSEITQGLVAIPLATLMSVIDWPGYGITLTPETAIIHRMRDRVMDWREVADISVRKEFCFRTVVIWRHDLRHVTLLAPTGFFDRKFDEKVEVIRAYWQGAVQRGAGVIQQP